MMALHPGHIRMEAIRPRGDPHTGFGVGPVLCTRAVSSSSPECKGSAASSGCTGPCGPCTELYYDLKPERGLESVDLEDDSR